MLLRRTSNICLFCNPNANPEEDEPYCFTCEECDALDLEEFEDDRRLKMAERNEY